MSSQKHSFKKPYETVNKFEESIWLSNDKPIFENEYTALFKDRYPCVPGHCLFIPKKDDPKYILNETIKAEKKLNQFIDEVKIKYNLENDKICLSGFSQGCMMSINLGLTSKNKFSCVVGFSGKIIKRWNI